MNIVLRPIVAVAMACTVTSSTMSSEEIRQPESVLPWTAPKTGVSEIAVPKLGQVPGWLQKSNASTAKELTVTQATTTVALPVVETHRFAVLGQIGADGPRQMNIEAKADVAVDTSSKMLSPPFQFYRARQAQADKTRTRHR